MEICIEGVKRAVCVLATTRFCNTESHEEEICTEEVTRAVCVLTTTRFCKTESHEEEISIEEVTRAVCVLRRIDFVVRKRQKRKSVLGRSQGQFVY